MATRTDIRFVYFDLGNILLSFDAEIACANVAKLFSVTHAQAKAALYEGGLEDRFEHGELSPEAFATQLKSAVGVTGNPPPSKDVLDAISDMFTPIDAMAGVMDRVHRGGHGQGGRGIGILSNTCHAHWDWVMRQSYDVMIANLDATILSFEVGAMKPSPRIYEVAERAAGCAASQILFIDDKPENIAAAVRRGWNAEQCFGGEQAIGVLRKFGVLDG